MNRTLWYAAKPKGIAGSRARLFVGMRAGFTPEMSGADLAAVTATQNHSHVRPKGLEGESPG